MIRTNRVHYYYTTLVVLVLLRKHHAVLSSWVVLCFLERLLYHSSPIHNQEHIFLPLSLVSLHSNVGSTFNLHEVCCLWIHYASLLWALWFSLQSEHIMAIMLVFKGRLLIHLGMREVVSLYPHTIRIEIQNTFTEIKNFFDEIQNLQKAFWGSGRGAICI